MIAQSLTRPQITLKTVFGTIHRAASVLLALALSAPAALNIMPLRDVRAGMHATGRTIFSGSTVETFQADILGVLDNIGPKQSLILARLSGGPLEHTGVMQGMSGSPVYIDGKLIGAVALALALIIQNVVNSKSSVISGL